VQSVEWELAGEPKYSEKTCPSATLSTTNPTLPDLGSNPCRHGKKPATNRLSCGTAFFVPYFKVRRETVIPTTDVTTSRRALKEICDYEP
jgi:hypothetical protein